MDQNTLIEILKGGISTFNSTLSAFVGAFFTTLFLRKNTKTTEFEKLKAGKFSEAIDEMLNSGKMTYLEFYKCNNFLEIAKRADAMLPKTVPEQANDERNTMDFDWFCRFFNAASNISNQDMQKVWASVLAGEVYCPGSFSLRTIDTLYNMSPAEALLFKDICRIVIDSSRLFSSFGRNSEIGQDINEEYGFDNGSLRLLEECGIINGLMMRSQLELVDDESGGFVCGDRLLLLQSKHKDQIIIPYNCYTLTMVGSQLYSIAFTESDDSYLEKIGKAIKDGYPELKVSLHPISAEGEESVSYNANIDFLNK